MFLLSFPTSFSALMEVNEDTRLLALLFMGGLTLVLVFISLFRLIFGLLNKDSGNKAISVTLYLVTILVLLVTMGCLYIEFFHVAPPAETTPPTQTVAPTTAPTTVPTTEATLPTETTVVTEPPVVDPMVNFHPHAVPGTDPETWGIEWEIIADDEIVDTYSRPDPIYFGVPEDYTAFPGVSTFRGNNFRTESAYGAADITKETVEWLWTEYNGSLNDWPGCGWTGQPLLVQWDEETKQIMNLYDSKKEKEDLVEVIYGTLDGYIYFLDLDDGSRTRDSIYIGMNMKGSGSLDPRGYPLMYVGSGDYFNGMAPRMYVVSLVTGEILYEHGHYDSYALRDWSGFDSAPLVSAETDTLIWPGENGLLYTIRLNTQYDKEEGTLSVDPDSPVMARYSTPDTRDGYRWVGMENSIVVVGPYLYVADNGGMFFCVDLNTMELIWVQDTKDDNNATPVFEWGEDNVGYLYTAPSLHWTASGGRGEVSIYKLNAQTGEIVWEQVYKCDTIPDLSGGVQSSPVLGRIGSDLEGMIFFSISYTPYNPDGLLTALDTETGETLWDLEMDSYSWSSPVAVYTPEGKGYLLMASFEGTFYLIDGATGEVLDACSLGSHTEASPVVFENKLVIGTRGCEIYGLELN